MARILALTLATVLVSPVAIAGDREEAERYFERGNRLFAEGKLEESTRMFQVCVALSPDLSGPYRRLGQALRRLGRCPEAVDNFLKYLELKPKSRFSVEIRDEMRKCAQATELVTKPVKPKATGELQVTVNIAGARVFVGDRDLGASPVPSVRLPEGPYTVLVAETRHEPWSGQAEVVPGGKVTIMAELVPLPVAPRTDPGRLMLSVQPAGAEIIVDDLERGEAPIAGLTLDPGEHMVQVSMEGYEPVSRVVDVPPGGARSIAINLVRLASAPPIVVGGSESSSASDPGRTAGWILVAGAATAAVAGAAFGIGALGKASDYEDAGAAGTDRRALKEDGEGLALTADIAFGAAAALGIAGIVMIAANPERSRPLDDAFTFDAIVPFASPTGAGLSLGGRY